MKWKKGFLLLISILISTIVYTTSCTKKEKSEPLWPEVIAEFSVKTYNPDLYLEEFVIISTQEGKDTKKYLRMAEISPSRDKLAAQMESVYPPGIEASRVTRITKSMINQKNALPEGTIETLDGVIRHKYKEFDKNYAGFEISIDGIIMFQYIGKKEAAWKVMEKILAASIKV
jgi:hypothetical protein